MELVMYTQYFDQSCFPCACGPNFALQLDGVGEVHLLVIGVNSCALCRPNFEQTPFPCGAVPISLYVSMKLVKYTYL